MTANVRAKSSSRGTGEIWRGPYILRNWAYFWGILLVVAWGTPNSLGVLICGGVALHALRGPRHAVEALGILAFLIVLGKTSISLGRWLVLFAAFGRVLWDGFLGRGTGDRSVPYFVYLLLLFYGVVLVLSLLASRFPVVSGLKVTSFTVGVGVTVTGFYRTRHLRDYWLSWLFTLAVFILLASIPFYGLGAGYSRNGVGFQGILTHPQTFGPVLAPIAALLTGLYFFRRRTSTVVLLCMGLGWAGMYFSLSRTSMLAAALAGLVVVALGFAFKPDTWAVDLGRSLGRPIVVFGVFTVLTLGALQWTTLQSEFESFLAKGDGGGSLTTALEASRGNLMDRSMANFWDHPLTGIGFGAPSDPARFANQLERGPYGIPLSASVEKGFMPTAVLEETGLIGAALTILLLIFLFVPILQHPDPTLFWMAAASLFVNFGEMVFFSVGGMGFFFWFVMAFCHVAALRDSGSETQPAPAERPPAYAGRGG
ncbi:O-antigen ligase family protein [Salinibacter ruber]|uniref:O-antigen ligase family protein n=1 Tax=Salinibacter ruber TaxID=146919 RepID=UPI0021678863|nr:O-antigen ligase family protein [Salinibacter ruber]MCS3697025.1 hypothetical protein [Salinibacter ruber]